MIFSANILVFCIVAFLGGVVSLFSPCSATIFPVYLVIKDNTKLKVFIKFFIGLFVSTLPTFLSIYSVISIFSHNAVFLNKIIGLFFLNFAIISLFKVSKKILIFNLLVSCLLLVNNVNIYYLLVIFLTLFSLILFIDYGNIKQFLIQKTQHTFLFRAFNSSTAFFAGIISGLTLGSCIGPILGAIITWASSSVSFFSVLLVVFFYTLGIAVPGYLIIRNFSKLTFLQKVFKQGKLLKFNLFSKTFFFHSTNLVLFFTYILLFILFFFYNGSFLYAFEFLNIDSILNLQDGLTKYLF